MSSRSTQVILAAALLAAFLLAGCQTGELAACKDRNSFLEYRISEYEQRIKVLEEGIQGRDGQIKDLTTQIAQNQERVSILENENENLRMRLLEKPSEASRVIQGVEEIRRMQREAAEKLRQQQTDKPAESPQADQSRQ